MPSSPHSGWHSWPCSYSAAAAPACRRPAADAAGRSSRSYERETAPYYPFTASERGLHQYDRVLANDIGADYLRGLKEICTRYREDLRRLDAATLAPRTA